MPDSIISILICTLLAVLLLSGRLKSRQSQPARPRACRQVGEVYRKDGYSWRNLIHTLSCVHQRLYQSKERPTGAVVDSLFIYPIKSCRAVQVQQAENLDTGFKYDRQYTFAEYRESKEGSKSSATPDSGWHFVTQRKYGKLANITVEVWEPDSTSLDFAPGEPNVQSGGVLVVRYPDINRLSGKGSGRKHFEIPFNPTEGQTRNQCYRLQKMTIWKDTPDALLITSTNAPDSHPWIHDIQTYIGCSRPLALFRVATGHDRQVFRNAPRIESLGYQSVVSFADAYPLHILGLASVGDLDRRLKGTAPEFSGSSVMRFRANIYFKGSPAYAEDSWKLIRIGQQIYHVACRTTRCELPNTDQLTGKKHLSEPSKTIRHYRDIDKGAGRGKACMGMQMVPAAEKGIIRVGDEIEILETGEHRYILQ